MRNKRKIDVVILFEKAVRELDVCCLLKILLEKKGLKIEIVHILSDCGHALKSLDPSIVVLPYCYDQESNNIYLMHWRKSVFINLNWEQFFYKGNVRAKTPKGEFPLKYVKQVVWSENFKKFLQNKRVLKTNIFVSGNPYLGLYNKKYIKYFKSRAQIENEFGIKKNDYLIFFPENYNWAFYSKKMLDQMVKNGQSKKQVYKMKKYTDESFKIAMEWCQNLLKKYDNVQIILRPRPSTSEDEMRDKVYEILNKIPRRLKIIRSYTTVDWTICSDIIISSYSTTLIEAALLKKNIYMLSPLKAIKDLEQEWHPLVKKIYSYNQFEKIIRTQDHKKPNFQNLNRWTTQSLLNKKDPIKVLVNYINEIKQSLNHKDKSKFFPSKRSILYNKPPFVSENVWWYFILIKSFVSMYKDIYFPIKKFSEDDKVDISAKKDISIKCDKWRDLLVK